MDSETKKYLKSISGSPKIIEALENYILDFGIIDVESGTDAELGARLRARKELEKEIVNKFRDIKFLADDRTE